ncbi:hypothetical protein [Methylobacterium crusticola]|uniref:hypothetical protein n=1 Tax=Methylobacterium crusticola TaxID=1697972 RepID=UPI001396B374|nr:hypothetical protein [Methylobacterium crusticola]
MLEGLLGGGTKKGITTPVEFNRARLLERLGTKTLSELVAMVAAAGLKPSG